MHTEYLSYLKNTINKSIYKASTFLLNFLPLLLPSLIFLSSHLPFFLSFFLFLFSLIFSLVLSFLFFILSPTIYRRHVYIYITQLSLSREISNIPPLFLFSFFLIMHVGSTTKNYVFTIHQNMMGQLHLPTDVITKRPSFRILSI